ncbi:MAG TPA: recombinase family protein [Bryobacteraceae bacterium]|jgi:DNA invertase Pin-like site-specific DNA recombinase|nr:recombinase family protein [Bryobacteraceae bacterium]
MTELLYSLKIKPEHLARKAIVYLRQSSEKQVRQNKESQRLQLDLAERMRTLGWKEVEIIGSDLGSSAAIASARREGFERVLSSVALGTVGVVGSREVSRLSRTDKDWCRLLEVCQIFGTLIADDQQVYDLNYLDDQLVLGIKGTLSVVELKVLRQRLQAGQESKARRGELLKRLPVGYTVDAMGKIALHPDRRVCEAVQLVFAKFRECWTVRQTFQCFRDHDIELPVNPIQGTQLVWKIPTQSLIGDILRNPFYAGAYVWGRRPVKTVLVEGRLEKRQGALHRAEECRVFIPEHHVGYIDWATYEENQRMIRRNSVNWQSDESMAAIRDGQGLLVGLIRCGHCGRKLHVRYWGGRGTHARYLCKGDYDDGGKYCIGFGGASVDRRLSQELLKVITPLGLEASLKAIEELSTSDTAQHTALSSKLEQLEYEAKKAFEQYDAVDARNRLAAAELERRWNQKLEDIEDTKRRLSSLDGKRHALSAEEEQRIQWMGTHFAEIWYSDRCPSMLKKMIFRTIVEEIIVCLDVEKKILQFTIHWKGGVHTRLEMGRPRSATETTTPTDVLDIIRRMAVRHGDDEIASVLNRLGYLTGKGKRWNQYRVATARQNHSIAGQKRALPDPDRVSLNEAARLCGVSHRTIERLVDAGLLKREQAAPRAPWRIRRADLEAEPVRNIVERLRGTGKLILPRGCPEDQPRLFAEKQGDDNARHHE